MKRYLNTIKQDKHWINVHTTKVTIDGQEFIVKTDAINKYGMEKVIAHIKQHFGVE